jgi:hypothetical protein
MPRTKNTPFQITVPHYREPISGVVNSAMAAGSLVQLATTAGDARELVAAAGGRYAILEVNVLSEVDWQAYCVANPKWRTDLRHPIAVGQTATARFFHEAEFEGTSFFTAIDGSSTAQTLLRTAAGKFAAATLGTHQPQARLQRKVDPVDAATFRWLIENLD